MWRPIDYAGSHYTDNPPFDRSPVLVGRLDMYPACARWQPKIKSGNYWFFEHEPGGGTWITPDYRSVLSGHSPTHWMAIPLEMGGSLIEWPPAQNT